jgi:hypothetical protein
MQLKLGIVCIAMALPCAMWIPVKNGGYVIVACLLVAGAAFAITAPPLPRWEDDDTDVPAPRARPNARLRRKKSRVRNSAVARDQGSQEDDAPHDTGPSAA